MLGFIQVKPLLQRAQFAIYICPHFAECCCSWSSRKNSCTPCSDKNATASSVLSERTGRRDPPNSNPAN